MFTAVFFISIGAYWPVGLLIRKFGPPFHPAQALGYALLAAGTNAAVFCALSLLSELGK